MKLDSEIVRQGFIKGEEHQGFYTALSEDRYLASILKVETNGFGPHVTKICESREQAINAINDAWADLENS